MIFKSYSLATSALLGSAKKGFLNIQMEWLHAGNESFYVLHHKVSCPIPQMTQTEGFPIAAQVLHQFLIERLLQCNVWAVPLHGSPQSFPSSSLVSTAAELEVGHIPADGQEKDGKSKERPKITSSFLFFLFFFFLIIILCLWSI